MRALSRGDFLALLLVAVLTTGCSGIPRDPEGTLERVQASGVLRAGASPSGELVVITEGRVAGREASLVEGFGAALGAEVRWRTGGEEELVEAMERGELDLIAGGLSAASPWAETISLTRPYAPSATGDGSGHVLAVPMGENAMLVRLERYLDEVSP